MQTINQIFAIKPFYFYLVPFLQFVVHVVAVHKEFEARGNGEKSGKKHGALVPKVKNRWTHVYQGMEIHLQPNKK